MEKYNFLKTEERIPILFRTNKRETKKLFKFIEDNNILSKNPYLYSLASWANINFGSYDVSEEFSEIKELNVLNPEETYDLEVEEGHSYTANGIICHNTHNVPENITEQEINNIYFAAWKVGCKGCTIYREGSRTGVLLTNKKLEDDFIEYHAPKRPKSLSAEYHLATSKGIKFAVIVGLYKGKPYEIFAFQNPPINDNCSGEIVKVKKGHYNFISEKGNIENIHLATELVEARTYTILLSMLLRHGAPLPHIINIAKKVDENISSFSAVVRRALSRYIDPTIVEEKCPECGGDLVREEGCVHCNSCSFSKCG